MASVTYNAQSFAIDGRRTWIVGASIDYARVVREEWPARIAAAREGGFNTIATACPWSLHEPRRGRYLFQGQSDLRRFVTLCREAEMRVILRAGPFVGAGYDCGGLPAWLSEQPGIVLREGNEAYLERVARYLRKLIGEIVDLQASQGGPILLVQAEHAWNCSNRQQEERYLNEITRILRESGITVPIINANDLWPESHGTIDTWRGWDQMLRNVRQLRTVQPDAPRLVSEFDPTSPSIWGEGSPAARDAAVVMRHMAEILAAGGQPIVRPFHGGTNFGFLAGRQAGAPGHLLTTSCAPTAPLGEAGTRTKTYLALRRLASFVSSFGAVFADLDPDYQPVTLDPDEPAPAGAGRDGALLRGLSVVPLRGSQGRVVFVFSDGPTRQGTLLLDHGVRMPIDLGDQLAGWYLLEVDLLGQGRLDYVNLCPLALVGRSTLVLQGPEKAPVYLSVSGTPLQERVPAGERPLVVAHKGITFIICNQSQIDATYHNGGVLYVGVRGFDAAGQPVPEASFAHVTVIDSSGEIRKNGAPGKQGAARRTARGAAAAKKSGPIARISHWSSAPADQQTGGQSPRFATLDGPQTLAACGAGTGYGWYRIQFKVAAAGKRTCHLPRAADRAHLFLNGEDALLFGVGPGAEAGPFDLRLHKGENTLVALVENYGHFSGGNDLLEHKGIFGHLYEIKPLAARPKTVEAEPVSPFSLRGYVQGMAAGQLSDAAQACWTFSHSRKSPILVDVVGALASGTFVLNGAPIAYYAGRTGGALARILLDPAASPPMRRGKNELRFAPDPHQEEPLRDFVRHTHLYECTAVLSEPATWAFAKWEAPPDSAFKVPARAKVREGRGRPVWWKAGLEVRAGALAEALWLEAAGLSKGQVYVNRHNLGRYFTARADGRPVGPQTHLYLPRSWLHEGEANELVIFDEHGFDPQRVRIVATAAANHS